MGLEINNWAEINAVNVRAEGNDEHRERAIDIKMIIARQPAAEIANLFGAESFDEIKHLWSDDEAGAPALTGITMLESWVSYHNSYQVDIMNNVSYVKKISKFKLYPVDGHSVKIDCTVSVLSPTDALVKAVTNNVKETVKFKIIPPNELPFG